MPSGSGFKSPGSRGSGQHSIVLIKIQHDTTPIHTYRIRDTQPIVMAFPPTTPTTEYISAFSPLECNSGDVCKKQAKQHIRNIFSNGLDYCGANESAGRRSEWLETHTHIRKLGRAACLCRRKKNIVCREDGHLSGGQDWPILMPSHWTERSDNGRRRELECCPSIAHYRDAFRCVRVCAD